MKAIKLEKSQRDYLRDLVSHDLEQYNLIGKDLDINKKGIENILKQLNEMDY